MAREGLERLDGVASVDEDPDLANRTARVYLKKGRWLTPAQIAGHLAQLQIGATLRGVEATVKGTFVKDGDDLFLRVGRAKTTLKLLPLARKVQQDPTSHVQRPITALEKSAYAELHEHFQKGRAKRVCVTGVLGCRSDGVTELEVRQFVLD